MKDEYKIQQSFRKPNSSFYDAEWELKTHINKKMGDDPKANSNDKCNNGEDLNASTNFQVAAWPL